MRTGMVAAIAVLMAAAGASAAPAAYHITEKIAGPDGGWDYVRVDPGHDRVLVTRGGTVTSIDLKTKAASVFATGARLHIALPVNNGAEILLTNGGTDGVIFIDAATGKVLANVATGKGPDSAAIEPGTGMILVVNHSGGDVTIIDPRTHAVAGTITVGGTLEELVADGKGRAFVNVEDKNEMVILDLKARSVIGHYPLTGCEGPTGLAYDAADKIVISACNGSTVLTDAATGKVVQAIATGKGADGIAWDARRKVALVSAGGDGVLNVISLDKGKGTLVQTLPTARGARTIGIDDRTGNVFLPSADYAPDANGRRAMAPGTFKLIVVAP